MNIDLLWIGIGIAAFGYFLGDGLKNFKNPSTSNFFDFLDDGEEEEYQFIKESHVHYFLGVRKEDAANLLTEYPDIPHTRINGNIYYQKVKLTAWLKEKDQS